MLLCPKCWNTVCGCEETKVEIDDKIAPAITILNHKGYKTAYCCAGHALRPSLQPPAIYVKFQKGIIPDLYTFHCICPNWVYIPSQNIIEYRCKEKFISSVLELNKERENLLKYALEVPSVGMETINEQIFKSHYKPYKGIDV